MPVITLVPQTELAFAAPWTTVGAANSVLALADDSDSSYIQRVGSGSNVTAKWDLTSATLAANQRVSALRLRFGLLGGAGSFHFEIYDSLGSVLRTDRIVSWSPCYPLVADDCDGTNPFTPAIYHSEWWPGAFTGGSLEIDQAYLNGLQFWIDMTAASGTTFQMASLQVEVDIRTKPTVVVNPSTGTPSTMLISWVPTLNDSDVQSAWELAVFSESQYLAGGFDPSTTLATYRVSGSGATTTAPVLVNLSTDVNYRAYVRVAKHLFYGTTGMLTPAQQAGIDWYSDWSFAAMIVSPVATSNYVGPIVEGELGCHDWRILLQARGGGQVLAEIPWSSFSWNRVVNDMSSATVTFPFAYCTVDQGLASARSWRHEIGIWRSDRAGGWQQEWVGPMVGRQVNRNMVTLRAKDMFAWFEHRRIHGDYTLTNVDLVTLFSGFALDALGPDNSMGIEVQPRLAGQLASRTVASNEKRKAADQLRDLSRSGVDFVMIARTLLCGGSDLPLDDLVTLIDEHCEPEFDENGEQAATDIALVGKLVDTTQILGAAANTDLAADLGLLETTIGSNDIDTTDLADFVAAQNLDLLQVNPEEWTVTLTSDSPNGYAALIPGARWPVNLVSLAKYGTYRFKALQVSVTRQEAEVAEEVKATLVSLAVGE